MFIFLLVIVSAISISLLVKNPYIPSAYISPILMD